MIGQRPNSAAKETMSRRHRVIHKIESLDSRYGSPVVARLISTVMRSGKKSVAERIVYEAIERSREGSDSVDPLDTLHKALENAKPRLEVKSRRVGGATYQVPIEVPQERQVSLGHAVAGEFCQKAARDNDCQSGGRDQGCRVRSGQRDQEA